MPRKNKRRIFGKGNKNKSAKLNRNASSSTSTADVQQEQHESDSDNAREQEEQDSDERKSEYFASNSLVVLNESLQPAMGQLESSIAPSTSTEMNSNTVGAMAKDEQQQHKATITLKVIQFIGELPKEIKRDGDDESEFMPQRQDHKQPQKIDASTEINEIENDDNIWDNKSIIDDTVVVDEISELSVLHNKEERDVVGDVPILDHNKESEKSDEAVSKQHQREHRSFDDNYRVESPKQICIESNHTTHQRTSSSTTSSSKRNAMLIQEISESSSSEEVKQFFDTEATALEMKIDKPTALVATSPMKTYRVDSPESSDESNCKIVPISSDVMVQEISESSSSESVKNEILASISAHPLLPPPPQQFDTKTCLKIINIKELPSEEIASSNCKLSSSFSSIVTNSSSSKINIAQSECKTEKKLNKAEEAILEALYGNKSLLQIPNVPLDAISEEGSDCGSDVDKQPSNKVINREFDEDDDVFLPSPSKDLSKKPPTSHRRQQQQRVVEQPQLINTKIIETESNIPEGCKSWETTPGDSELQAELVYLTSTSSSATDLSERDVITDTDENNEDTSEDTEPNSLLENISVPSLDNFEHDTPIEMRFSQSPVYSSDYFQEVNEQQKLPDIEEEDEDQSQKSSSLDINESQQQIEDVNKELHHLVNEHEEIKTRQQKVERVKKEEEEEKVEERETEKISEDVHETISVDTASDKKKISSDNDDKDVSNRVTPTTPTPFKRKNSSDSSSSANSQCTIIRQNATVDHQHVDPLKDLCMQSLSGALANKDVNFTIQKKLNSLSRNAPQIPIINELELHYKCDNDEPEGRENNQDRVITILQVPPAMHHSPSSSSNDNKRWIGLQSSQIPNLLLALSPLQTSHMMNNQDSSNNTSADVLLDMHRKFVERRAYHEVDDDDFIDNTSEMNESQLESANHQLEEGYFGDRENSVENIISSASKANNNSVANGNKLSGESRGNCDNSSGGGEHENVSSTLTSCHENKPTVKSADVDIKMNSIRNLLLREEFFKNTFADEVNRDDDVSSSPFNRAESFEVKKFELENELQRLDRERRELEEELKNIQSLQHFKREEFLFNEKKLQAEVASDSRRSSIKNSNDDFKEFVNSNEKLQEELYNEWQDKILERYERKLQKTIKITSISEAIHNDDQSERAASENLRFAPLESEFMIKLRERQKRLSLPNETELNSSTESLHHQNEETKKIDNAKKVEIIPAHLHEFLKYYEEEIVQSKNSDESGESKKTLAKPLIGLIVLSMCFCGFFIGKHFITQRSKLF
jgi:hypothetical protein